MWRAINKVHSGRFVLRVIYDDGIGGAVTYQVERHGAIRQVLKIVDGECVPLPVEPKLHCVSHTDISGKGTGRCVE